MHNPRKTRTSTTSAFTLKQFIDTYHENEVAQRETFFKLKWSDGYVCPECGNRKCHYLNKKGVYQCSKCCHQESLLSHTAFQNCRLGLYTILMGVFLFSSSQNGISGTQLAYDLGINVNSARLFLRKLRKLAETLNNEELLEGTIDIDGAYLGGVSRGKKRGRGSEKQSVLVAIELENGIYPGKAMISPCKSENGSEIVAFVTKHIKENSELNADKSTGFDVLRQCYKDVDGNVVLNREGKPIQKYPYKIHQEKSDSVMNPMKWLHIFISNFKAELQGIYHGIPLPYLKLYIGEYLWRYNNRGIRSNKHKVHMLIKQATKSSPISQKDIMLEFRNL